MHSTDFSPLESLTNLKRLWLHGDAVTDKDLANLRTALPLCNIWHD